MSVSKIRKRLIERATDLEGLQGKKPAHRLVVAAIDAASASLVGCGEYLEELGPSSTKFVDKVVGRSKNASKAKQSAEKLNLLAAVAEYQSLIDSADLISKGKDKDAWLAVGKAALKFGGKILARFSGYELVEAGADALDAGLGAAGIGKASRLRKKQVREASALLGWLDAVTVLSLGWCYLAQTQQNIMEGKTLDENAILEVVTERIAKIHKRRRK
jgi:hypothetical protein